MRKTAVLTLTPVDRQLKAMARAICKSCGGDTAGMYGVTGRYRWEDYLPEAIAARKARLRYQPKINTLAEIEREEKS
jgi:hypothetical protein